jgi:hypothetical protein
MPKGKTMKIIVRGVNYTEVRYINNGQETIRHWIRQKHRKKEECGVWIDGVQTNDYTTMEKKEAKP